MMGPSLDRPLMEQFDGDQSGTLSREEFRAGFGKWFGSWNVDKSG